MLTKLKMMLFALALIGLGSSAFVVTSEGAQASHTQYQARNMFVFGDPTTLVAGAATLTRTKKGIAFSLYTSELDPGVHSVWIVIFNRPDQCAMGPGACAVSDLNDPAVKGSVAYGVGYIVGTDGIANFHGSLKRGSPPIGIQVNVPLGTYYGLRKSMKASIHLVVRKHGATDATGGAVEQLTTFQPECGDCANVQAVVFEPVA